MNEHLFGLVEKKKFGSPIDAYAYIECFDANASLRG